MKTLPARRNSAEYNPFRSFRDAMLRPVTGKLRDAEMTFTRVGFGREVDRLHIDQERRDAFYVIFQLRDQPPHEFWADGRSAPAPASPKGSVHIADLNTAPSSVLDGRLDSLNMVIPRAFLDELAEDAGASRVASLAVPEPWTTRDPVMCRLGPMLIAAQEDPSTHSALFVDHIAVATALHLAERYGPLLRVARRVGALAPWQERRARDIIADNLTKDISLAEVAAQCGLSLAHFSRAFKASVGMTPHDWLQSNRIDKAKDLLTGTTISLAEIAVRAGFADQSHLNRMFKRSTGLPPGVWRRVRRA